MSRSDTHAHVFDRGSKVGEYWLAHADGFAVRSHGFIRERVERVVVDPMDGRAKALIVRAPFRRQRLLTADAFVGVDPFECVLHLEREQQARASSGRIVSALLAAVASMRRALPPLARAAAAQIVAAAAWLRPRLLEASTAAARYGRQLGIRTQSAARWLRPRLRAGSAAAGVAILAAYAVVWEVSRRICGYLLSAARIAVLQARELVQSQRAARAEANEGRRQLSATRRQAEVQPRRIGRRPSRYRSSSSLAATQRLTRAAKQRRAAASGRAR